MMSLPHPCRLDLVDDDLDAAVLRLPHVGAGRYQQMRFAEAPGRDRAHRHAVLDQFRSDCLGAIAGEDKFLTSNLRERSPARYAEVAISRPTLASPVRRNAPAGTGSWQLNEQYHPPACSEVSREVSYARTA
jgi:hypothetical protein